MGRLLGVVFSARTGGNLYDLASHVFAKVSTMRADLDPEIIEIAHYRVEPCNHCQYECLLSRESGYVCPIEDDVLSLWRKVLSSEILVYFLPTYGGMPPATWFAFRQRYHGVFRCLPEAARASEGKIAVVSVYDPAGAKTGDVSQDVIAHYLASQGRQVASYETIIPSTYGLNSLRDRLIEHAEVRDRLDVMGRRIAECV